MSQPPSSPDKPMLATPQTPPGKEILQFPENQFTPEALHKLSALKRKASELSLSSPSSVDGYVKWRLLVVRSEKEYAKAQRESCKEAFRDGKISQVQYDTYRSTTFDQQQKLETEEKELLAQGKFIEDDLKDSVSHAEGAYIHDLYKSWRMASEDGQKRVKRERALSRNKFNNAVAGYFAAERKVDEEEQRYCSIMGDWIPKDFSKCAHLVPKSFDTRGLAYIFGAEDAALASVRNAIVMVHTFETAFDNGWVTIVPDGSVEATPTEWKAVLLNDAVKRNTVMTRANGRLVRFEDLHNQRLTWQNDNRPARRYLYFRYVLAIFHAEYEGWEGYRDKVPSGKIWASPSKPNGYLRRSVLRSLARRIGDEDCLPDDLIEAGGFIETDPPTGTEAANATAGLEIGLIIRRELSRKNRSGDDDDSTEDEDMEE